MSGDHMVTKIVALRPRSGAQTQATTDETATKKLIKRVIESLPTKSSRYTVWDADMKGFGVRVSTNGRKAFVVRYRTIGGADRLMVIGALGVFTPEEARERARLMLAEAAKGGDPQQMKMGCRHEMTVSELCELYMAEGTALKKASTLRIDRIRIDRHIKPRIGRMKVSDVKRADIQRLMIDVGSGTIRGEATPHTRGGKHAAARTVGLLGGIFTFAMDRDLIDVHPTRGVKRYRDNRRERYLSPKEMARLGDVLLEMEKEGGDPRHINIIRLLLLTGARKNEIARLKWSEVDLERGMLRLKDSKTGPKTIRLGAPAVRLMDALLDNGSPFVFPDRRNPGRPVTNLDWAWVSIRRRAGMEDLRIHDLRHSFASAGLAGGEGLPLISKLLGHSHISTTSRYAHLADDPLRAAADRISELVAMNLLPSLVTGDNGDPDAAASTT